MRAVAWCVLVLFLAGCASSPPPGPAPSTSPTSPSGAAFSVPAPALKPGQWWAHSLDVSGRVSAGPFTAPVDEHSTLGGAVLADGYASGARPVLVAADLAGPPGARGMEDMAVAGAVLLDPSSLQADALDLGFLRSCQAEPAACPTDLAASAGGGDGEPGEDAGRYEFPLEPGKSWDSAEAPRGFHGAMHVRVAGQERAQALGRDVDAVRLNFTGHYDVDRVEDGARITGTVDLDGSLAYSPELMTAVEQRAHETDHFTLSQKGQSLRADGDLRIAVRLVAADLDAKPALDPVELYEAFGLDGRALDIAAAKAGPGKVKVTLGATETPLDDVAWTVTGPDGAKVQDGTTREFELALGQGVHRLHAEARHKGRLLAAADANLTADGVVDGGGEAGTPVDVKETVTCDLVVLNLPAGHSQGACPNVLPELGPHLKEIHATVQANSTFPSGAAGPGVLQLIGPGGSVRAEAPTTDGKGSVAYAPAGGLDKGTWAVRYAPQAALQSTAFIHATAT